MEAKQFQSLLGFLLKREYEKDESLSSLSSLQEMIFSGSDLTEEFILSTYNKCINIIERASYSDVDLTAFESLIKDNDFTQQQQEGLTKFWKTNKKKIHDIVNRRTRFNNSLDKMSWRLDLKTKSKDVEEMNEPTAIVELDLTKNLRSSTEKKQQQQKIRFEMDRNQLQDTLEQINIIQKLINGNGDYIYYRPSEQVNRRVSIKHNTEYLNQSF
ncbi:COMM domain-containing protein 1 [Heterostelium album PN500]|uniref:COMM domain-containing protein 1 n=1 Tax=Heterostelium pallidum (strain ATCC 26659 / Pp 5 / PN500) TaxID=670386 RepID=D3BCX7_HETP5|nr:COMM domain-containing protein 1 [Heterostelium album PN500]EFA80769.1 COMM domain-containing protein 1 [Heterostelium album PN500]|eukprot:XP_020432888.1 COMM domain-containing protein 1 [Heterostelium album PN500]